MFDRFTDRAKKCMSLARKASLTWNHEYIGTEHMLLGVLDEGTGVACNVLKNLPIDLDRLRTATEARITAGARAVTMGQLPFTPRAKVVFELAMDEAHQLSHNYIGTEHLMLGLLAEARGIAALALQECGVDLAAVRAAVLEFLGGPEKRELPRTIPERTLHVLGFRNADPTVGAAHESVGHVRMVYATEGTPGDGWLTCDGRRLARNEHPELFAVVGERSGDDPLHFHLPDYRGLRVSGPFGPDHVVRSLRFSPRSEAAPSPDAIVFWIKAR